MSTSPQVIVLFIVLNAAGLCFCEREKGVFAEIPTCVIISSDNRYKIQIESKENELLRVYSIGHCASIKLSQNFKTVFWINQF